MNRADTFVSLFDLKRFQSCLQCLLSILPALELIRTWQLGTISELNYVNAATPGRRGRGIMGTNDYHSARHCWMVGCLQPISYSHTTATKLQRQTSPMEKEVGIAR